MQRNPGPCTTTGLADNRRFTDIAVFTFFIPGFYRSIAGTPFTFFAESSHPILASFPRIDECEFGKDEGMRVKAGKLPLLRPGLLEQTSVLLTNAKFGVFEEWCPRQDLNLYDVTH